MNRTLDYYNTHSSSYVNNTQSVDFSSIQDAFIAHMDSNALILILAVVPEETLVILLNMVFW